MVSSDRCEGSRKPDMPEPKREKPADISSQKEQKQTSGRDYPAARLSAPAQAKRDGQPGGRAPHAAWQNPRTSYRAPPERTERAKSRSISRTLRQQPRSRQTGMSSGGRQGGKYPERSGEYRKDGRDRSRRRSRDHSRGVTYKHHQRSRSRNDERSRRGRHEDPPRRPKQSAPTELTATVVTTSEQWMDMAKQSVKEEMRQMEKANEDLAKQLQAEQERFKLAEESQKDTEDRYHLAKQDIYDMEKQLKKEQLKTRRENELREESARSYERIQEKAQRLEESNKEYTAKLERKEAELEAKCAELECQRAEAALTQDRLNSARRRAEKAEDECHQTEGQLKRALTGTFLLPIKHEELEADSIDNGRRRALLPGACRESNRRAGASIEAGVGNGNQRRAELRGERGARAHAGPEPEETDTDVESCGSEEECALLFLDWKAIEEPEYLTEEPMCDLFQSL